MADLLGNLLVAQSGGTTAAINASLVGAVIEAGRHPDQIEEIYGALNGISGVVQEEMIDLQDEKQHTVDGLKYTPVPALGAGRYQLDFSGSDVAKADLDRLFAVFQAHSIRYFLQIGGRSALESSLKLHEEAVKRGYEMRILGIPSSIENDLPLIDAAPGCGSAIKCCATSVLEIAADLRNANEKICCIVEVAGQATGWIPAGAILAKRNSVHGPHIILLPEVAFDQASFIKQVQTTMDSFNHCLVVVGEKLSPALAADSAESSPATQLAGLIQKSLNLKTTTVKLGQALRSAAHLASAVDANNAIALGAAAVRAAADGQSGMMVKTTRRTADDGSVRWSNDLQGLSEVLGAVNTVPRDWLSENGFLPNEKFIAFAQPLIEGELNTPFEHGLPKFTPLDKVPVEKKLPPYV
jgi:ATP-dependent phosphofructokinase / diphosphate-dependent phosphofructokinase